MLAPLSEWAGEICVCEVYKTEAKDSASMRTAKSTRYKSNRRRTTMGYIHGVVWLMGERSACLCAHSGCAWISTPSFTHSLTYSVVLLQVGLKRENKFECWWETLYNQSAANTNMVTEGDADSTRTGRA